MHLADQHRLFVALDPAPDARAALAALSRSLCEEHGGRAPPAANLHVTLAFLGRIDLGRLDGLVHALGRALTGPRAHGRAVDLVARPTARRARLLALSLADEQGRLAGLISAARIAIATALERPDPDTSVPWPHVTLARFRPPTRVDVRGARNDLTQREQMFAFDRASLYNSEPSHRGLPRYRALATFELD